MKDSALCNRQKLRANIFKISLFALVFLMLFEHVAQAVGVEVVDEDITIFVLEFRSFETRRDAVDALGQIKTDTETEWWTSGDNFGTCTDTSMTEEQLIGCIVSAWETREVSTLSGEGLTKVLDRVGLDSYSSVLNRSLIMELNPKVKDFFSYLPTEGEVFVIPVPPSLKLFVSKPEEIESIISDLADELTRRLVADYTKSNRAVQSLEKQESDEVALVKPLSTDDIEVCQSG